MRARREGIHDRQPAPGEALGEVFRQQQPTSGLRGNGDDASIPDVELVLGRDRHRIGEGLERSGLTFEQILPAFPRGAGLGGGALRLAHQNPEQLTRRLDRENHIRTVKRRQQNASLSLAAGGGPPPPPDQKKYIYARPPPPPHTASRGG